MPRLGSCLAVGDTFVGDWRANKKHGVGTYTWTRGMKFKGKWQDGRMHGNGLLRFPDGRTYEGGFIDNVPTGHGALVVCFCPSRQCPCTFPAPSIRFRA